MAVRVHHATSMNRYRRWRSTVASYERVKGSRSEVMCLDFCERGAFGNTTPVNRMAKFNARWSFGLFLGATSRSGGLIVVYRESNGGKEYVRTVKRILV